MRILPLLTLLSFSALLTAGELKITVLSDIHVYPATPTTS